MRRDVLELDLLASADKPEAVEPSLADTDAIRLLLSGDSVIDWQGLSFVTIEQVDMFLLTHCLDIHEPVDRERLRYVFNEAVSYLEEHLHLKFPRDIRNPDDVRQVFLWAAQHGGFRRRQILSCVILKLMHVIHHMEAADLKFKAPISEEMLFDLAEARILRAGRAMREAGVRLVSFYGSRKSRGSVITKLLAKKENLAATVFDKLRFRIIVEQPSDLVHAVAYLSRHVFPFNYAIPGQSFNNLIEPGDLLPQAPPLPAKRQLTLTSGKNEFSGKSYRMINFIVDYPVRLPDGHTVGFGFELGRVVYLMVEFQVLDEETARNNEIGENAHHLYKERQQRVVERRLKRGGARRED